MKIILQRVTEASVSVDQQIISKIGPGWLVLLGVTLEDSYKEAEWLAKKTLELRAFSDVEGKMNADIVEAGGDILVVSQFTLYGSVDKGRRPSFHLARTSEQAEELYEHYVKELKKSGLKIAMGSFGAMMAVSLVNDGPVTFIIERNR